MKSVKFLTSRRLNKKLSHSFDFFIDNTLQCIIASLTSIEDKIVPLVDSRSLKQQTTHAISLTNKQRKDLTIIVYMNISSASLTTPPLILTFKRNLIFCHFALRGDFATKVQFNNTSSSYHSNEVIYKR